MSKFLNRAIGEVLGAARANPDAAPQIFGEAARQFRVMAADPRNAKDAPALTNAADQFSRATGGARFGTDFEVLLRDHHKAYMATPDPTTNDLEVYGRQGLIAEEGGDPGGDDDVDGIDDDAGPTAIGAKSPSVSAETGMASFHIKASPPSVTKLTPIGRTALVKFNPTPDDVNNGITQSSTVILWQGDKFESQACTIDIGITENGPGAAPDPLTSTAAQLRQARPYAVIEYGADGFRAIAKVDVGYGLRTTVVGNYVSVLVGMDPINPAEAAPSAVMSIGASLGFFAATSVAPVTKTEYIDDIQNWVLPNGTPSPNTAYVRRPLKAQYLVGIYCFDGYSPLGSTAQITFQDAAGYAIALFDWGPNTTQPQFTPIPIPNDCSYIRVRNNSPAPLPPGYFANYRLVFQLAL